MKSTPVQTHRWLLCVLQMQPCSVMMTCRETLRIDRVCSTLQWARKRSHVMSSGRNEVCLSSQNNIIALVTAVFVCWGKNSRIHRTLKRWVKFPIRFHCGLHQEINQHLIKGARYVLARGRVPTNWVIYLAAGASTLDTALSLH